MIARLPLARDVLDATELEAHYRAEAAARVARRPHPARPDDEDETRAEVAREYQRIRMFGGV